MTHIDAIHEFAESYRIKWCLSTTDFSHLIVGDILICAHYLGAE